MNAQSGFAYALSLVFAATVFAPHAALAEEATVACVDGKFGDHVDGGRAVGDGSSIFGVKKAVYWLDVSNTGEPTHITLVWSVDGKEVQRQSLDVGRSPHWHTWGMRPLGNGTTIDVEVLDASGASLRKDSLAATTMAPTTP